MLYAALICFIVGGVLGVFSWRWSDLGLWPAGFVLAGWAFYAIAVL